MKRKVLSIIFLGLSLIGLQQLIVSLNSSIPGVRQQIDLIKEHEMEPSVIFYTESPQALKAEKEIRESLNQ